MEIKKERDETTKKKKNQETRAGGPFELEKPRRVRISSPPLDKSPLSVIFEEATTATGK